MTTQHRSVKEAFDRAAAGYDADRRVLVPCFDDFYGAVLRATSDLRPGARVLDLGAGTGLLAGMIAAGRTDLDLTLVDISPEMLAAAKQRMSSLGAPFSIIEMDYSTALPPGPWDAVVSALSIHHLSDAAKRHLNACVIKQLAPGALFTNAEQIIGETEALERRYDEWWVLEVKRAGGDDRQISGARQRMQHDLCSPVKVQLQWLEDAGFADVHCPYQNMRFAVLQGQRRIS